MPPIKLVEHDLCRKPVPTFRDHALSTRGSGQAIEGCRPALAMQRAGLRALEALLQQNQPRSARRRLEGNGDLGLVAAHAVLAQPTPGEHQPARWLDHAIDAADRLVLTVSGANGGA